MPVVQYDDSGMTTPKTAGTYSPAIWGHLGIENNPSRWAVFEDQFTGGLDIAATGSQGQWYAYIDTSDTITTSTGVKSGAAVITTAATDNNSPGLSSGVSGSMFTFQVGKALAFETRIAVSSIATMSIFVGLIEEACNANNGWMADTQTAMADVDYVGFVVLGDTAASTVNAAFNTSGGTDTNAKAAAHTLVANTYVNLGFRYAPSEDRVYFYVDGAKVASQTTVQIGTDEFPDGQELGVLLAIKNGSGAARTLTVDYVRAAVEI